jgi:hypothetical protein
MIATTDRRVVNPAPRTTEKKDSSNGARRSADYALFQTIQGNRKIDKKHVDKLKTSIEENDLFNPILVNEEYQIIDGQHRFHALQALGKPIEYIVVPGYGIKQVQLLNTHSKNWSVEDYLECYIKQGVKDYVTYKEFREAYGLNHKQTMQVLGGVRTDNTSLSQVFREGAFKVGDINKAVETFKRINAIGKYYDGYRRTAFISALLICLKNKKFDFDEFEHKLSYQTRKMVDCTNTKQYIECIEDIYNFKSRTKVSLA